MGHKEKLIIKEVNKKNKSEWSRFYSSYYAALCVYVSKFIEDTDAVEDLVQDIFIKIWESDHLFESHEELTNYLYRACYNNALLYIRDHQIRSSILSVLAKEEDLSVSQDDELYILTVKEEIIRQLYYYIEKLPTEQRRIILLRVEGRSWNEIAEYLGVSINTVKTQKARSYKFLRENLQNSPYIVLLFLFFP
ncbi:MAG TPA: RNA polymerase subunit sigma-70 [Porphyromonadaceae bacterium]|jgi:RNA polymerase sigma-70 factor (ECF subfamily)|uniref:RNA polymerase sigma-70 factor n=1 Tax=Limibacterium fermenti TaxID=3229863 RepID=UPI000E827207|nr:RNA polymerase subunit sigma-70 [Porphyromonadaceae bacterium]HBK30317.1 RNA polymerase subunit sigma-70 [Porphyromonadaceae bacterium]HBL34881.1 RNA polymerase subunit sigma-70 [Porphyromonadaceae bacterium]HBX19195.1 RNA polymerase subunit sigma-70 [Porphyromonadaceae bacterium]HBX46704.1 RNA polymerase subunit sigma-70 [Porphyromonadaceae bacterium]